MWRECLASLLVLAGAHYFLLRHSKRNDRRNELPPSEERIVILGASSVNGIGAAIARRCMARGAYNIMLVGRRSDSLREVKMSLIAAQETEEGKARAEQLQLFVADCTDEEDVLRLSLAISQDFGGLDTLYIVFGVICTQSLLALENMDPVMGAKTIDPTLQGLLTISETTRQSNAANISGTALVLAALIPYLQTKSKRPYVAVIGSLAALVPAPTRALYCASKAAQQMLVQSVAAECASQARIAGRNLVRFVVLAPSTVATSFSTRMTVGPKNTRSRSLKKMLSPESVGNTVVECVDRNKTGVVPMPYKYFLVWLLAPLLPGLVERGAHRRYEY